MTEKPNDLGDTVSRLAAEKYPDIPLDLVMDILAIESEFCDNRSFAMKQIVTSVEKYLLDEEVTQC